MRRTHAKTTAGLALLTALLLGAGCGDDTTSGDLSRTATSLEDAARRTATTLSDAANKAGDEASKKADDASNAVDKGLARVQAEAFRLQVKNLAKNDATKYTSVSVLRDAAKDLPASANVSGITDADGDGKDDDGKVSVTVDTSKACVTVSTSDIGVSSSSC